MVVNSFRILLISLCLNIANSSYADAWRRVIINNSDEPVTIFNKDPLSLSNYIDNADFSDTRGDNNDFNGYRSSSPLGLIIQPHTTTRIYVVTSQYDAASYYLSKGSAICSITSSYYNPKQIRDTFNVQMANDYLFYFDGKWSVGGDEAMNLSCD